MKGFNLGSMLIGMAIGAVLVAVIGFAWFETHNARAPVASSAAAVPVAAANTTPKQIRKSPWFTKATEGHWKIRCRNDVPNATVGKACLALLQVVNGKTHQLIMVWMVGQNKDGGTSMTLESPTGVMLQSGIGVAFDKGTPHRFAYNNCAPQACQMTAVMDPALLAEFRKASQAAIILTLANGQVATVNVGIDGADKMLDDLGATATAAPAAPAPKH